MTLVAQSLNNVYFFHMQDKKKKLEFVSVNAQLVSADSEGHN